VRNIRLQKNLAAKESITLELIGEHDDTLNPVIMKTGNITEIKRVAVKSPVAASFLVGTTEYAIPLPDIDPVAELEKLNKELFYLEGFLQSVNKKLSNEKFVANAKPEVVEIERKKLADTESKIKTVKEQIAGMKI
jgi:valyl-tRNA synthetase